jgi:hypothetical protein
MHDRTRLLATVAIWTAFVILLGTFLTGAMAPYARIQDDTLFAITLIISATTGLATFGIWGGFSRQLAGDAGQIEARKQKRPDQERVTRLVEQLDDDAMIELETLLVTRKDH